MKESDREIDRILSREESYKEKQVFKKSYVINSLRQTIWKRGGLHEEPVVLVGRLGEAHHTRLLGHGLSEIMFQ